MKKIRVITVICLLALSCNPKRDKAPTEIMTNGKFLFSVTGMTCPGCENTIKKQLVELEGVDSIYASFENKKVIVWVDTSLADKNDMVKAIEKKGYNVTGSELLNTEK